MLLADLLPAFTTELCAALESAGDLHLAEQVRGSQVLRCSYDQELEIGTVAIDPQGLSLTAETNIVGERSGRRNVHVSSLNATLDLTLYGFVHGVEIFSAKPLAEVLKGFDVP